MTAHRVAKDLHVAASNMILIVNDPGDAATITIDRNPAVVELVTATAETRTLADPAGPGVTCVIVLKTDGGDCVVTASSAINQTGNTVLTFGDVNDSVQLYSIQDGSGTFAWRIAGNDTVAASS